MHKQTGCISYEIVELTAPAMDQCSLKQYNPPDSKIHGANMGPIWDRHGPDGPHVGPMNFAIWVM